MQKTPDLVDLLRALIGEPSDPTASVTARSDPNIFQSCQFLRACQQRRLTDYLGQRPSSRLRSVRRALTEIGCPSAAQVITDQLTDFGGPSHRNDIAEFARDIEDRIAPLQGELAVQLTRFAALEYMDDEEFFDRLDPAP